MKIRTVSRCSMLVVFGALLFSQPQRISAQSASVGATQVRMKWQDFIKGPAGATRLANLKKAIAKMKSLDSSPKTSMDYRRSWEYWANIHGYYGASSMDGTVAEQIQYLRSNGLAKYDSYYHGIVDQTPPDADASKVWATCEHSYQQNGKWVHANFWGWHRMYLYYFERVLRWASEDDTLRLPYWDYTDPTHTTLPAEFQDLKSVLYNEQRNPQVNAGASLDPDTTNINNILTEPNYIHAEFLLERGVHGQVHCETSVQCPVAHMGDVPVAGNDPIFYEHHANIDRIWSCWQKLYPPVPDASWQDQEFTFPDETGNLQTKQVKNFLSTSVLGYIYDHEESCERPGKVHATPVTMAFSQEPSVVDKTFPQLVASKSAISLLPTTTTVELVVARPLLLEKQAPTAMGSTQLVIRDLTAEVPPGQILKIYIANKNATQAKIFVAAVSWFHDFGHHNRGPSVQTLSYDVTAALQSLGVTSGTTGITVSFEASTGLIGAKSTVEKPAPLATFRPDAKLRLEAVELRQVSSPQ